MNVSVVNWFARKPNPTPLIQSVILILTPQEAVELQRIITPELHSPIKDRIFDALTRLFHTEGIDGGIYIGKKDV